MSNTNIFIGETIQGPQGDFWKLNDVTAEGDALISPSESGHWLKDYEIAIPMHKYLEYRGNLWALRWIHYKN